MNLGAALQIKQVFCRPFVRGLAPCDHFRSHKLCEGVFWPHAMFVALANCGSLDLKKFSRGYRSYAPGLRIS